MNERCNSRDCRDNGQCRVSVSSGGGNAIEDKIDLQRSGSKSRSTDDSISRRADNKRASGVLMVCRSDNRRLDRDIAVSVELDCISRMNRLDRQRSPCQYGRREDEVDLVAIRRQNDNAGEGEVDGIAIGRGVSHCTLLTAW